MFKIFTDTACNLPLDIVEKYDLEIISLSYIIEGEMFSGNLSFSEENLKNYYNSLRENKKVSTTCANQNDYYEAFRPYCEKGYDILFISFSSGLSSTYSESVNATEKLRKEFPNLKILVIDSLLASLGQGLLVYTACNMKEEGKTIEEIYDYIEKIKFNVNSIFTVKTLSYLAKGGRISKLNYALATVADIKPILYVNEFGKLVSYAKVMGRKRSMMSLVDKLQSLIISPENQVVFISHGDCLEDAKMLAELITKKTGVKNFIFNYIDPVIGTHSGPDTLAVFFFGVSRVKENQTVGIKIPTFTTNN